MATGAAYDAILQGSITLTLKSELNLSDNYLDIFKKIVILLTLMIYYL